MIAEIKTGDYVRNKLSGKFGNVVEISPDNRRVIIQTLSNTYAAWRMKNLKLIKDAKR